MQVTQLIFHESFDFKKCTSILNVSLFTVKLKLQFAHSVLLKVKTLLNELDKEMIFCKLTTKANSIFFPVTGKKWLELT